MGRRLKIFVSTALSFVSNFAFAQNKTQIDYNNTWEGDHRSAKSEAWTWMGHLNETEENSRGLRLKEEGYGIIHYYTRNDAGIGSLTFRSSALTPTLRGVGQSFEKKTIYSAQTEGFQLRIREGKLDIELLTKKAVDRIRDVPMRNEDQILLTEKLLPLYPGLRIAPGFKPIKSEFDAEVGKGARLKANLYTIWPVVAPSRDGKITFLGMPDTYTFSRPMMLAVGRLERNGTSKAVAGLIFLDRQWGTKYFGQKIFENLGDLLKFGHALSYSHSWSAFHARNPKTGDWAFFHLWQQFFRQDKQSDEVIDYSNLIWTQNGVETGTILKDDYSWEASGFVKEKDSKNLLNYAAGRTGFFPSRYQIKSSKEDLQGTLQASPALQSLDQPIYLYEGYASGSAEWRGGHYLLRGRVESSRLLFRNVDYSDMMEALDSQERDWRQPELRRYLNYHVTSPWGDVLFPVSWFFRRIANLAFLLNDMELKMEIFGKVLSGIKASQDPKDSQVFVYR